MLLTSQILIYDLYWTLMAQKLLNSFITINFKIKETLWDVVIDLHKICKKNKKATIQKSEQQSSPFQQNSSENLLS